MQMPTISSADARSSPCASNSRRAGIATPPAFMCRGRSVRSTRAGGRVADRCAADLPLDGGERVSGPPLRFRPGTNPVSGDLAGPSGVRGRFRTPEFRLSPHARRSRKNPEADSGDRSTFRVPGQHPVQMVGKRPPLSPAQRWRSAGVYPAGPHRIHEVAHVEPLADGLPGMELAARAERMDAALHHFRRQRDVGGDDEVAAPGSLHDFVVRDVESRTDLHELDVWRRGNTNWLIGDQGHLHPGSFGRPEQDLPDRCRARIGIHPYLHGIRVVLRGGGSERLDQSVQSSVCADRGADAGIRSIAMSSSVPGRWPSLVCRVRFSSPRPIPGPSPGRS